MAEKEKGKGNDTGFPITNVGNDGLGKGGDDGRGKGGKKIPAEG